MHDLIRKMHDMGKKDKKDKTTFGQAEGQSFTVRYDTSDLDQLKALQESTGISAREWIRALLSALLESYRLRGEITLPLAVVPRSEAVNAGLLKPRTPQKEQSK